MLNGWDGHMDTPLPITFLSLYVPPCVHVSSTTIGPQRTDQFGLTPRVVRSLNADASRPGASARWPVCERLGRLVRPVIRLRHLPAIARTARVPYGPGQGDPLLPTWTSERAETAGLTAGERMALLDAVADVVAEAIWNEMSSTLSSDCSGLRSVPHPESNPRNSEPV